MHFEKVGESRDTSPSNPCSPVKSETQLTSALADFSLPSISPTRGAIETIQHHECSIEKSSQAFIEQVEFLLKNSSLLAAVNVSSGNNLGIISLGTRAATAFVKCGSSDSAAYIDIDYTPAKRRALFWQSPAMLEACITIEGQAFKSPECAISAPGQSIIDQEQHRSWFSSRSKDWTHERVVLQVAQYLGMVVERALEFTRIQNQGLTVIDLNPRFERDLVAQAAVMINLPELPAVYARLRLQDNLESEAQKMVEKMQESLAEFKTEIDVHRSIITAMSDQIQNDAKLIELRNNYEVQLRQQYYEQRNNMESSVVEDIKNEALAQHAEKVRIAQEPSRFRSRAQILTAVRMALSSYKVEEQLVVSSAEKCSTAFLEHPQSALTPDFFVTMISIMMEKTRLSDFSISPESIDSRKLGILCEAIMLIPQHCSWEATSDFMDAVKQVGGYSDSKVEASDMLATIKMLLNIPSEKQGKPGLSDNIFGADDSSIALLSDEEFSLSDDSGVLVLGDELNLDLRSLDDSGIDLARLDVGGLSDIGSDSELRLFDLSDSDLRLLELDDPNLTSGDSGVLEL